MYQGNRSETTGKVSDYNQAERIWKTSEENHSIVMISGGSGIGRVSQILSFTARSGEHVIWFQFGSSSLYTEKFWRAFVKSIHAWDRLLAKQLAKTDLPETIQDVSKFTTLLNQTSFRSGNAIFVFEDTHLLKNGPVSQLIDNMVRSCIVGISSILISDGSVDIASVSGLRMPGFTEPDRQLAKEEIRIYYTALGIVLNGEMLDIIWQMTGGWTAAVHLMGRHLSRGEFLTTDSVDNAIIFMHQYFQEHYHAAMRPEIHQALILLSLLSGFTMALAVELTSITVDDLKTIARTNEFICYRCTTNSYYFHKIYQQFLEGKQIEVSKKIRYAFLRKAASRFEQQGMIIDALSCYIGCEDYDRVIPNLRKISVPGLRSEQATCIGRLLESIPEDYMNTHPEHRLYHIFALFFSGKHESSLRVQERLQRELEQKQRSLIEEYVLGEIYVSCAFQAWRDGGVPYLHFMKKASEQLPKGTTCLDSDEWYFSAGGALQFVDMAPGDLLQVKEAVLQSIPYTRTVLPKTGAGVCYLTLAEIHMYRMEFHTAMEYANRAISEAILTQQWGTVSEGCYIMQRISMTFGELDDVLFYVEQIRDYIKKLTRAVPYSISHISEFHLYLYLGLHHLFEEWVRMDPLVNIEVVNHVNISRELYVHAVYKVVALRQYYPSLTYIDNAIQVCRSNGMWFSRLKLVLLKGIVYNELSKPGIAAKFLIEAYHMSAANDIVLSFAEFGKDMVDLLHAATPYISEEEIPQKWRDNILKVSEQYGQQRLQNTLEYLHRYPHIKPRRLELLTRREYRALKFACMGKTTEETAELMGVIPATINSYFSQAYKKLGTDNKAQAIRIALTEGILN